MLPICAVVIVVLFAVQSRGTGSVGRLFGPVMALWFVVIGVLGADRDRPAPVVLLALSPTYAVGWSCSTRARLRRPRLGGAGVTGAEALYADMGHFGARPIRLAWTVFVLPCLVLNYFGQGALVLARPERAGKPVLPAGARLAAPAAGHPGDRGDGDRQPGADLRRLSRWRGNACSSAFCRA